MNKNRLFRFVVLIVILLDQLTKLVIKTKLSVGHSIPVIRNIFHITYIQNTGAGFGILQDQQSLLIWLSVFVIGVILYNYDKIPPKDWFINSSVAFILGGTLGNLVDRVMLRYVIDFLDFRIWPAFNIADSALTLGVIGFIIYHIKEERKSKKKST